MTDKPSHYFAAEAELHEAAVTYADYYPEPGEHNRDALLVAAVAYAHAVAELVPPDVAARAEPGLSFTEQEADRNAAIPEHEHEWADIHGVMGCGYCRIVCPDCDGTGAVRGADCVTCSPELNQ